MTKNVKLLTGVFSIESGNTGGKIIFNNTGLTGNGLSGVT
jgi:hypothetical protein